MNRAKPKSPVSFETKLSDLIRAGLCRTPFQLEKEYKGVHLKAIIQGDGTVTVNNEVYDSLSTAGGMARKAVMGAQWRPTFPGQTAPQTNGWTFWKFQDPETGKLLEVDVLRQKYLKRSRPDLAKA